MTSTGVLDAMRLQLARQLVFRYRKKEKSVFFFFKVRKRFGLNVKRRPLNELRLGWIKSRCLSIFSVPSKMCVTLKRIASPTCGPCEEQNRPSGTICGVCDF